MLDSSANAPRNRNPHINRPHPSAILDVAARLDQAPAIIGLVLVTVGYGSCLLQLAGLS